MLRRRKIHSTWVKRRLTVVSGEHSRSKTSAIITMCDVLNHEGLHQVQEGIHNIISAKVFLRMNECLCTFI